MKKIVLQTEACIGCGACVGQDSEHFEFSDDGFSVIKSQENLDSPALQDAIDACPVAIISLENCTDGNVVEEKETEDSCNGNCKDLNDEQGCCEHCACHDEKKAA